MSHSLIARLLREVAVGNAGRSDFREPAISRARAELAIQAILDLHGCRGSDAASIYAYDRLMAALGIDWGKSSIVRLSDD